MKLFIFEYITGGGFISEEIPSSLACEGSAMLLSVLKGLLNPNFIINILLDKRLAPYSSYFKGVNIKFVKNQEDFNLLFKNNINNSDYFLIIAPEFDNILNKLTKIGESSQSKNLGCNSESIKKTGNKMNTYNTLSSLQKFLPITSKLEIDNLSINDLDNTCRDINYPVVFKPTDGVGGEGISLIKNKSEIEFGIKKIRNCSNQNEFIIQEFIDGDDVSVSLFIKDGTIKPLTLNYQLITLKSPHEETKYKGGYIPFTHNSIKTQDIFDIAKKCIKLIPGLAGYVGIDFILKEKPYIIEINPRLTTSYVGVRELVNIDLYKKLILNLDNRIEIYQNKNIYFSRLEINKSMKFNFNDYTFKNLIQNNLITPLFQFKNGYSCFILLKSNNLKENLGKLENIKKYLLKN
ncbi:MAG: ATP-grasp domain-containing protein [Candidatus Helarchaeota archaeon]